MKTSEKDVTHINRFCHQPIFWKLNIPWRTDLNGKLHLKEKK